MLWMTSWAPIGSNIIYEPEMITARVVGMINGDLLVMYEDSDEKDWSGGVATGIGRRLDKAEEIFLGRAQENQRRPRPAALRKDIQRMNDERYVGKRSGNQDGEEISWGECTFLHYVHTEGRGCVCVAWLYIPPYFSSW